MDGSCSLYILTLIYCQSSKSTNFPAGLGSYPCTQRQVNLASDLTRKLLFSNPHPTPGVSLLHVMGSYDKICTHLIEAVIWFPEFPSHWVIGNPIFSRRKCSFWHSASIQLVCVTVGLQEWLLRQVCILQCVIRNWKKIYLQLLRFPVEILITCRKLGSWVTCPWPGKGTCQSEMQLSLYSAWVFPLTIFYGSFPDSSILQVFFLSLFLAALGLCCCEQAFSSCGERGLLFVAVHGLLIAVASLVVEHRL